MRILCIPAVTKIVYAGVALPCGTRHEENSESGLAHFTEHLCFKGTKRFSAMQIINRMEAVGGELNAYTGKETTIFYSIFDEKYLNRAINLLVEMVFNSTFPQNEIEKEVEVVADEIESYNDSPCELIFDEFEELLFPEHPLGRNILGKKSHLKNFTTKSFEDFVHRNYNADEAVFFMRGNFSEKHIRKLVEKALQKIKIDTTPQKQNLIAPPVLTAHCGKTFVVNKNTHQAHVIIGTRAYGMTDDKRWGLNLLTNILGGPGMNSRLNLALREKSGLVYVVESNFVSYTDTGVWNVYFGCDKNDVERCIKLVKKELHKLTTSPLSAKSLNAAKTQLKGQMSIATDNFENFTLSNAKRFLHTEKIFSMDEICTAIDLLTAEELQNIAQEIFDEKYMVTLIYK